MDPVEFSSCKTISAVCYAVCRTKCVVFGSFRFVPCILRSSLLNAIWLAPRPSYIAWWIAVHSKFLPVQLDHESLGNTECHLVSVQMSLAYRFLAVGFNTSGQVGMNGVDRWWRTCPLVSSLHRLEQRRERPRYSLPPHYRTNWYNELRHSTISRHHASTHAHKHKLSLITRIAHVSRTNCSYSYAMCVYNRRQGTHSYRLANSMIDRHRPHK